MVQYDVEAFMAACERKGLAAKTMGSYEQTLRLFGQFLSVREIERTEEVKRVHIESYIDYLQKRGKYTVCAMRLQTPITQRIAQITQSKYRPRPSTTICGT